MALVIYKSSAGSGKTFTLVNRFLLKVLEKPWLFNRILAITFTNKASEELKTRIIKELDILSKGLPSSHLSIILKELPGFEEQTLRKNAGTVLLKILHGYSTFSVSTIDSYFQKLARTLAKELLLPLKYEIELDTESICKNVTEMLLEEAGKNREITQWLEDLLLHRIDSGKNWNIRSELLKMTAEILKNDTTGTNITATDTGKLVQLISWLRKSKKEIENFMRNAGKKGICLIDEHGYSIDTFAYKTRGPAAYFAKIADKKSGLHEFENINSYTLSALENAEAFLSKKQLKEERLLSFVESELHPQLVDAVSFFSAHKAKYISVSEALKLIYQSGIIAALENKMKEFREQHQLFHLSDTTRMLSKSIGDQDAPFIYEKSGNTFFHVFIDEFQDTATIQWHILKPLLVNSLSTGNEVLIVGDAKQSIYRWRGGNMQLILEGISKELGVFGIKPHIRNLDTNWRSKKEIVDFNNKFFPHAATFISQQFNSGSEIFQLAYAEAEVRQRFKEKEADGGYLQFRFFEGEKGGEKSDDIHWKKQALEEMSAQINVLLSNNYTYGDIAILVRKGTDENDIADFLLEEGKHPFVSSHSLLISTHTKIRILLNCMRLLVQKNEALLHAEVNHFMSKQQVSPESTVPFSREEITGVHSWTQTHLIKEKDTLCALPLLSALYRLLDLTKMNYTDPFIQKFCDIIQEYAESKNSNLSGFLQWYDEHAETRKWSVELPDGGDAIRIISIHRSKGLEFPVVFIPFMNWEYTPSIKQILWVQGVEDEFKNYGRIPVNASQKLSESYFKEDYLKEAIESAIDNLNLMYVAFTRPEEKLFVYGPAKSKENDVLSVLIKVFHQNEEWASKFIESEGKDVIIGEFLPKSEQSEAGKSSGIYEPSAFSASTLPLTNDPPLILPQITYSFSSDEITFGNLIHEIISAMDKNAVLDTVLLKVLSKNGNRPYYKWKSKLYGSATAILDILKAKGWTEEEYRIENEMEICDESGMIYRPDKVLFKGDSAIVIDFKTGKAEHKHREQVMEYCRLIKSCGFPEISGYLLYTSDMEIVNVC